MNRYFDIFFSVFVFLIADAVEAKGLSTALVPQIKVTRIQIWFINPELVDELSYTIVKHNATYNNVLLDFALKEDLPSDVYLQSRVYATDSEHKNEKFLLEDNIPICKNSSDHELLPDGIVFAESKLQGQCFSKNLALHGLLNNFRFDVLIPNIHEISDYHFVNMLVRSKFVVMCNVTFYSEWGYLHID